MSSEAAAVVLKKTPLHAEHVRLGARMVDFGGWSMLVQYSGIIDEHLAVRSTAGAFDISHMGQAFASGPQATAWLNRMLTNNVERLAVGECQYSFLLNERGGVIDDLIVYRIGEDRFLLVINAAKIEEDVAWLQQHLEAGVEFSNQSDQFAGIAIQGPRSPEVFEALYGGKHTLPARNQILTIETDGAPTYIARTGYTGEDGFELFCGADQAAAVWNDIIAKGAAAGLKPCGLGARDTLRLEMCYPLNGSDLSPDRTPLEAGLGFFIDLAKPDFIGKPVLTQQKESGIPSRLVPFKMTGKTPPPRSHYAVFLGGEQIGETCSGGPSPSLQAGIGMAYLPTEHAKAGLQIEIDIRGRRFPATIEKKPLYRPATPAPAASLVP